MSRENWDNLDDDKLDYNIYHNQPFDPNTRKEVTKHYRTYFGEKAYKRAIYWFKVGWFNINSWGVPTVSKRGAHRVISVDPSFRRKK